MVEAIRCRNLVKTYPGRPPVEAVRGLDLTVASGECFGLLGPNGAGKTTTIEIIEGLTEATAGAVEVFGNRWGRDDQAIKQRIGISLQETKLSEKLLVHETVTLFRSFYERGLEPDEAIRRVSLEEKAGARVGKLSGGQRQRLAVACALVGDPDLLFLDEPTTGLDPQSRRQLWDLIRDFRAEERTVLLTTHYMDEAERLCDRVAIVDHGKVIALGSPRELIARWAANTWSSSPSEPTATATPWRMGPSPVCRPSSPSPRGRALHPRGDRAAHRLARPAGPAQGDRPGAGQLDHPPRQPRGRFRDADGPAPAKRMSHEREQPCPCFSEAYWPLGQLILVRLREFYREPEAVFWVYGFPILMVVALGIAFRNKPVERLTIDVQQVSEPGKAEYVARVLGEDKRYAASIRDRAECLTRLRTGKTDLVVVPGNGIEYEYDPTRPDSLLAPRVDDALQRAAGRKEPVTVSDKEMTEPGGRYIDFLIPGLLGMNLMGGGLWGVGFATVDLRIRKVLKRFLATPMRKSDFLASILISRLIFLVPEVFVLLLFARWRLAWSSTAVWQPWPC